MKKLILPIICAVIGAAMICGSFTMNESQNATQGETTAHSEFVANTQTPLKLTDVPERMVTYTTPAPEPEWITLKATAYCSCSKCCGKWADGITADGSIATQGITVAADWSILPQGTVLYIEGVGERTVQDTGVYGYWIDIYYNDHEAALDWGVRYVKARVVE